MVEVALNLSVGSEVYDGVDVREVAGRKVVVEDMPSAVAKVAKNVRDWIDSHPADGVILTGGTAIPIYLVAFHEVVHRYGYVGYDDGKGTKVLIASHGKVPSWA